MKKILIVEDDRTTQQLVGFLLKENYKIQVVSNGWEALEFLNFGREVDVIITDIEMPKLNGFELLKVLDQSPEYNQIPVVVMSSSDCEESLNQLNLSNYYGCLSKPILPDLLNLRVEEALMSKVG